VFFFFVSNKLIGFFGYTKKKKKLRLCGEDFFMHTKFLLVRSLGNSLFWKKFDELGGNKKKIFLKLKKEK